MKRIYFFIFIVSLFTSMHSQTIKQSNIQLLNTRIERVDNVIQISADLNLDNIDLSTQQMLILTPEVISRDQNTSHRFAPIVVTGAVRDKMLQRHTDLEGFYFNETPQMIVRHHKGKTLPLTLNLPYHEWLHNSQLIFDEKIVGCACKNDSEGRFMGLFPVLPELFKPVYQYSYITPEVELVKQRSDTYNAMLNFELNKHKLLRNYKNNRQVLDSVDMIIKEVRNDKNLTVTNFAVTGYASPEGNPASNMKLSENRAKAFVNYLMETYGIRSSDMKVDWKGEDWDGLKKVVQNLDLSNKQEVLNILNEPNVMTRKSRLHQLNGGSTYRMLLSEHYPPLRRNEYTISYVARGFDLQEAKEIIWVKPKQLSLNEMFLVANSYPKDSNEFKEIFEIALRHYPNDPVAQINKAAMDIENDNTEMAVNQLLTHNRAEAWNNLGIAYFKRKDYERARTYFEKASQAGLPEARNNMMQLSKFLDTQI